MSHLDFNYQQMHSSSYRKNFKDHFPDKECVLKVFSNGLYVASMDGKLSSDINEACVFPSREEAREFKRTFAYYCEIEDYE